MKAIIINLDNYIELNRKVVFFDKKNPTRYIHEVEYYEYPLLKNGHYKSMNNTIQYNGRKYYISNDISEKLKNKTSLENIGISVIFGEYEISDDIFNIMEEYDEYYLYSFILNTAINSDIIDDILKNFESRFINIKKLFTFKPNQKSDILTTQFERILMKMIYGVSYNKKVDVEKSICGEYYICDNNIFLNSLNWSILVRNLFKKLNAEDKKELVNNLKTNIIYYMLTTNNTFNKIKSINKVDIEYPTSNVKTFEQFIFNLNN